MRTEQDGNFDALALMDVATGIIVGMDMVGDSAEEISELQSRKMLKTAFGQVGRMPLQVYVAAEATTGQFAATAQAMGVTIEVVSGAAFAHITEEARAGFATHVLRGLKH